LAMEIAATGDGQNQVADTHAEPSFLSFLFPILNDRCCFAELCQTRSSLRADSACCVPWAAHVQLSACRCNSTLVHVKSLFIPDNWESVMIKKCLAWDLKCYWQSSSRNITKILVPLGMTSWFWSRKGEHYE